MNTGYTLFKAGNSLFPVTPSLKYTLFKDTYVMYQLLEFIGGSGIIALCKASKKLNEICKQYIEMEDDKRFEVIDWNGGLVSACSYGHMDIVKLMIKKCADDKCLYGCGLYCACEDGHMDIIKLMIEKGADKNFGLAGACWGGRIDIVKFMIKKGGDNWDNGLEGACESGNMDIVKLMIEKGADNWNGGLWRACFGGNIDIINLMIEKGATECTF